MRTGEIDGLKWQYIDFAHRLILVRETIVLGEVEDETKTIESHRDIQMSQAVFEALERQRSRTGRLKNFVFCNREGEAFDHNNITKRVWYPLLRHLGLKQRRPYQSRHTAATLWLAAGENPEWIARQMGHTSTEMCCALRRCGRPFRAPSGISSTPCSGSRGAFTATSPGPAHSAATTRIEAAISATVWR